VSLDPFLKEFISSYQGAEGVEMVYSEGGDMKVQADREALRKILVNLMENALEAMPRGGKIAIGCGRSGEFVEISLVDNGPGLPPEVQERLFEPYFSTKTNGTGLGLAISQGLAREMGGEIRLGNRVGGRGVKAVVVLPISG
ncbi:MAG: HAMP domain-containing histidine kinase, partial [Candidatus Krumholzibacteria bacterium]|nr:HAMP domain-containing histidine kinase [Candidatus Krumholzibacteria bacterium]